MTDIHNLVDDPSDKENVHAGGASKQQKNNNGDVSPLGQKK